MIKVINGRVLNKIFVASLMLIAFVLILKFRHSFDLQFKILVLAATIYLAWSLIYHRLDKSLTLDVFMEYLLTAILALVLLIGVLL